ncbi:MAG: hypothetical protein M3319_01680 [Actinomycetota bacterium]|nr:hypothetical protein [Actinomycetota bacterium]
MQVSEIFSMGGRGGSCGCDCDGGHRGGFSRFGDFNNRHFGGRRFHRSGFFDDGFRHRRHHRDGGLLGISISL